jgi:hypothetical protein
VTAPADDPTQWPVSPYCEAATHNTLSASKWRRRKIGCICEHSMKLAADARARTRANRAARLAEKGLVEVKSNIRMSVASPQPISATQPDFSQGLCTSPRGQETARGGSHDQASRAGIKARARAKNLCNAGPCPIRDRCRTWVLTQEKPAGSWGGVWGGLDPWNRQGKDLILEDGKAVLIPYVID